MNEYNHHRIIERVALDRGLDASVKKIFIKASDFTDFYIGAFNSMKVWEWKDTAKQKYFFYRFYYTININSSDTIRLNRITSNGFIGNNSIKCMETAGEKVVDGIYSLNGWDSLIDEKEFFSSVNDRKKSPHKDKGDTANQSDNVAFLHAMGAENENENDSKDIFEKHLKKCFAEYLFLENEEEALFMLGIAFHGIMDSFTPSHMGFQKYTEQDMGLHAQGDVIPIRGIFNDNGELLYGNFSEEEKVCFDPGQFKQEVFRNKLIFSGVKYYNSDAIVNPVEYKMLLIFFYISDIRVEYGNYMGDIGNVVEFWKTFKGCTLEQINDILKHGRYRYGPESYAYSEAAIKVISDVYYYLSKKRKECNGYSEYKNNKQNIVEYALQYWKTVYDGDTMKTLRKNHLGLSLYSKDPELEDWKAQQDTDRLNRLKG